MPILFFIILFYLVFLVVIRQLVYKKSRVLTTREIAWAFGFKVLMGCLYGYVFLRFYGGDDTWLFNREAAEEYIKLVHNPFQFLADFNPLPAFRRNETFSEGLYYYLSDTERWLITKPLAIFSIFSRGNYYINVVFFSFVTFWGPFYLYRLLVQQWPGKKRLLYGLLFFFPPTLFWLSGIRAEAWLLLFMALLLWQFHCWVQQGGKLLLLYALLALLGVFIFRNVLVLLLLPALLAWFIVVRYKRPAFITFVIVYSCSLLLFFGSLLFSATHNLPNVVAERQHRFLQLTGHTVFKLDTLQPTVGSFAALMPQAFTHTFLRPYIWEARGILQKITAADTLLFWLLLLVCLARPAVPWGHYLQNPLLLALLFFSLSLYLFIGYTIPFPGAIARYKIIPELFLLLILLLNLRKANTYTY